MGDRNSQFRKNQSSEYQNYLKLVKTEQELEEKKKKENHEVKGNFKPDTVSALRHHEISERLNNDLPGNDR